MNEIKNVILCGLGAIGTIYAAKISESDNINLKILADNERIQKYKSHPTVFNGKEYFFDFITEDYPSYGADLIIIATKNNGLTEALERIKSFVNENTIIISLLNGIKSEQDISQCYGQDKVVYSYYIGHTSTRQGRVIAHDDVYKTVFGEKDNTVLSARVSRLKDFFEKTRIKYEIPEDMDYARWWKFLVNVGYNQASAVLNAAYSAFQTSKKVNDIAIKLMEEAAAIAKKEGVKNTEKMIPEVLKVIKTMRPEARTSMLQDIDTKRQSEVDIFAGYVCELGKKHGIATPYNDMFFEIIKAVDEKNALEN